MKHILLGAIFLLINNGVLLSQHCLTQGIEFTSQHELDMFPVNYPGCSYIDGSVLIKGPDIFNLDGLNQIDTIKGYLDISFNPLLASLAGIGFIRSIGESINLANNPSLENLTGLDSIKRLSAGLSISSNNTLIDLHGLEALKFVGPLNVIYNSHLKNFNGLSNLDTIYSVMVVKGNDDLENFTGLSGLRYIRNNLEVGNNPNLIHPIGFDSVTSIRGLSFYDNVLIENFEGFESLTDLNYLNLYRNNSLKSLNGLSSIKSLNGLLLINDNDQLANIRELEELDLSQLESGLFITNSDNLSDCSIASICNFIEQGGVNGFSANASGCNTTEEVIERCTLSADDPDRNALSFYPNPTSGFLEIKGLDVAKFNLSIFDAQGRKINDFSYFNTTIDLNSFSSGIYFITIQSNQKVIVKRIIKT